jgi:hypothetical protein
MTYKTDGLDNLMLLPLNGNQVPITWTYDESRICAERELIRTDGCIRRYEEHKQR